MNIYAKAPRLISIFGLAVILGFLLLPGSAFGASEDVGIYKCNAGDRISGYRIISLSFRFEKNADGSVTQSDKTMIDNSTLYQVSLKKADEMIMQCDYVVKNAQKDKEIQFNIEFTLFKREGSAWKQIQNQSHETVVEPFRTLNGSLLSNSFKVREKAEFKIAAKCDIDGASVFDGSSIITIEPVIQK
jgi:hypothetical protein